ncbi:MAG: 4-phosphopantetheinyl transferase [Subtercola sp.]|nr:4-phosphopantetheinyl transferase [Subtercola sp.]
MGLKRTVAGAGAYGYAIGAYGCRVGSRCDIWVTDLGRESAADLALLSSSERRRRDDMVHSADRSRFTLGVALSRRAAGRALGIDPLLVHIDRRCERCGAAHGKPRLPGTSLQLSVSHSADLVAVALTSAGSVGIDVERIDQDVPQALAEMLLAPGEVASSASEFFTLWCRKESVVKATGDGMRVALTTVTVTAAVDAPRLLSYPPSGHSAGSAALPTQPAAQISAPFPAQLLDLSLRAGYAGALTVLTAHRIQPNIYVAE